MGIWGKRIERKEEREETFVHEGWIFVVVSERVSWQSVRRVSSASDCSLSADMYESM